jgi:hypothetical protein
MNSIENVQKSCKKGTNVYEINKEYLCQWDLYHVYESNYKLLKRIPKCIFRLNEHWLRFPVR